MRHLWIASRRSGRGELPRFRGKADRPVLVAVDQMGAVDDLLATPETAYDMVFCLTLVDRE